MKDLLTFILEGILGKREFEITETEEEGSDRVILSIQAQPEDLGLIIGKGGNTIKAIQTILRVRGRVEDKLVDVTVS